ncbi:KilA-N domain-containing protein [Algoriphagus halophilus]|uniref:KilA-N domain-containing protein n=1 Tax=Algoriphagus halophilus TaxID=226505 RepID=UPI00358ED9AA
MNTETIIEKFEEQEIAFDLFRGDLMVNATEMARPFRKRVRNWLRLDTTKALISAIKEDRKNEFKQLTSELFENEIFRKKEEITEVLLCVRIWPWLLRCG